MDPVKRALLIASLLAGACGPVAPYERETLSTERMRLDADPDEAALQQTRLRTREEGHLGGGGGGGASGGGGCGCN
jgi:hypothetical protein